MNEFLNHQMAHNTIIVDVEDELDETVFNFLFEKYPHVLFCPSYEEYFVRHMKNTIDTQGIRQ